MKTHLVGLAFAGAFAVGALIVQACSSEDTTTPTSAPPGSAPSRPPASKTASTDEHVYAVRKLFIGDTDKSGAKSGDAWRELGYNLDGKATTSASKDVCKNDKGVVPDGENGIDNAFGSEILPLVVTLQGNIGKGINDALEKGRVTAMLDVTGLDDNALPQTATGLTAQLFAAGAFDETKTPTWTTADDWPVRPELLNGPTVASGSKIRFGDAWVDKGKFASGPPTRAVFALEVLGQQLELTIYRAVITFDHTEKGKATNGTIAGVLKTEEVVATIAKIAGRFTSAFCPGTETLETALDALRKSSDMPLDGDNDPTKDCDGTSIGIAFEAQEIGKPTKVSPPAGPAGPDKCTADAGG